MNPLDRRNPLDLPVKQITDHPQFLTKTHIEELRKLIPASTVTTQSLTIEGQIDRQLRFMDTLASLSTGSTDISEVHKVMNAQKDLINLLQKIKEEIDAEKQLKKIEDSIVKAFETFPNPELRQQFMDHWNSC